jgi:riboflavin synthase
MFTGIISDVSAVVGSTSSGSNLIVRIEKPKQWSDITLGESISVNGACLTVARVDTGTFSCEIVPETIDKTIFGVQIPTKVNLERAMKLNDRLDGHIVQGHVDFVGTVVAISKTNGYELSVKIPESATPYVISKGSVALDGVSLTISSISEDVINVALIPYTLEHTTLGMLQEQAALNVELDVIGKYVVHNLNKGFSNA